MTIYLVREYGANGLAVAGEGEQVAAYHFVAAHSAGEAVDMLLRTGAVNLRAVDCEDGSRRLRGAILATYRPADGLQSRKTPVSDRYAMQRLQGRERTRASVVAV